MIHKNLTSTQLIEASIKQNETQFSAHGALVAESGKFTGRAAKDKYIVRDDNTENLVDWGKVNQPTTAQKFEQLKSKVMAVLDSSDSFSMDLSVGADPRYAMPLTVRTQHAYQALFAWTMFRDPLAQYSDDELLKPFNIYAAPDAKANPSEDGTNSETFIAINFSTREIVIGGTQYCGEIKKSVFTVMNYYLPQMDIMTMHASANSANDDSSAVFFGLSGTGKTTLSADASRCLIGDVITACSILKVVATRKRSNCHTKQNQKSGMLAMNSARFSKMLRWMVMHVASISIQQKSLKTPAQHIKSTKFLTTNPAVQVVSRTLS